MLADIYARRLRAILHKKEVALIPIAIIGGICAEVFNEKRRRDKFH